MSSRLDILVVEDEGPKREHILEMVKQHWPNADIRVAKSVRTAVQCLREREPTLLLLDMSLPTFDVVAGEPGGRPQNFGGIEVMRYLERFDLSVHVIVVTAYRAFPVDGKDIGLSELAAKLEKEHPDLFAGLIYFNSFVGNWRDELQAKIKEVLGGSQ